MDITVTLDRAGEVTRYRWHTLALRLCRRGQRSWQATLQLRLAPPRVIVVSQRFRKGRPLEAEREWTRPRRQPVPGA